MATLFTTTPRILMGPGSLEGISGEIERLGATKLLVVTDRGVRGTPIMTKLETVLKNSGLTYEVFDGVEPDPPIEIVEKCAALVASSGAELLVGFGGGSPIDIAKTAALLPVQGGPIDTYFGVDLVPGRGLPVIAVPTTAGTGSEATPIAILSDEKEKLKKGIVSSWLYPAAALIDPELTLGLPPDITAATGMDALIHAIEGFTSVRATGMTDMYCRRAMELICGSIRTACEKGGDIKARSAMMEGALLAGIGFANAGVAAVHAFAYPIGANFHIPHGVANTLMLPAVMRFNVEGNREKYALLAGPFGIKTDGLEGMEIIVQITSFIDSLVNDIGVPRHLDDFGITESDIPSLAEGAMKVTRLLANNPREVTLEDAKAIYRASL